MKEHPILFSTEMVKAILDGKKTMTRRVVKLIEFSKSDTSGYDWAFRGKHGTWNEVTTARLLEKYCHYGQVGGRLWVRETFTTLRNPYKPEETPSIHYKADFPKDTMVWKPSIFMPRWASRITLEIMQVRVERLQEITVEDCMSEGGTRYGECEIWTKDAIIDRFSALWDSINAKRGFSWSSNPWVWVIEFKRC
jgi:hypothetical protein